MPHFYERVSNKTIKYSEELTKLISMLNEGYSYGLTSTIDIINSYCFRRLPLSGNYIDFQAMLSDIYSGRSDKDNFINLSEFILSLDNQLLPSMIPYTDHRNFAVKQIDSMVKLIEFDLKKLNLDKNKIESDIGEIITIGPKNELLENALDIINNDNIESKLIRYNSSNLVGKVEEKEDILCAIYSYVEEFLNDLRLSQLNKRLFEDVSFLYNNLNMKHNNDKSNDTFFYESTLNDREEWLDRLFHNILLVIGSGRESQTHDAIMDLRKIKKEKTGKQ